jgi:hypothetical protein
VTRNAHNVRHEAPWLVVLLVFLVAAGGYLAFPSTRLNPDGLRVFPGLHRVTVDSFGRAGFVPNGWSAGYRAPRYERANVQKHLLFPLYGFVGYRLALGFGYRGSGLKPLQAANAIAAALAVGLFALLVGLLTRSPLRAVRREPSAQVRKGIFDLRSCDLRSFALSLAAGFGLAFSTAFSSMATSIAEVVPALPWLLLALIILVTEDDSRPGEIVCAGLALGISAAFYAASAAIGAALAAGLALRRASRRALLLAGTMAATVGAIYVIVLLLAGYHTLPQLGRALFFLPEQGTYGGLKPSNLVSIWLGFAGSIFPVLPDNFGGLRSLLAQSGAGHQYLRSVVVTSLVVLLGGAFFVALFRARRHWAAGIRRVIGLGLAIFAGALAVSLAWDPYHLKLWTYSNVGLWLMVAGYFNPECGMQIAEFRTRHSAIRIALITLVLLCVVSTNFARRIVDAGVNRKWQAAKAVARIVNAEPGNVVFGGWEDEADYLALLVPESNQVSLPDVIMEQGRDSARFAGFVARTLAATQDKNGSVFFLNLFNRSPGELDALYARRLRFPEFVAWLDSYRPGSKPVWQDPLTGVALYKLTADR